MYLFLLFIFTFVFILTFFLYLFLTFFFSTFNNIRPAIPNSITEELRRKVPGAVFTSNPCRLLYCTREIVILREDIVTKMCRNCVRFPTDGDIPAHVSSLAHD